MASNRHERKEEIHFLVMRILDEDPNVSTREIAERLGISNGSAYYCITALLDKGLIKLKNFAKSNSKSNYIYQLTPRGIKSKSLLAKKFLERKREEYHQLKSEISILENEVNTIRGIYLDKKKDNYG